MAAWQFSKLLAIQDRHGSARFISMQDHYKLVTREEEREMLPLCVDAGVDTTPWSPLARGLLTRPYGSVTARLEDDRLTADGLYTDADSDRRLPPPSPPGTA